MLNKQANRENIADMKVADLKKILTAATLALAVIPKQVSAQVNLLQYDFEGPSPGLGPTILSATDVSSASNFFASTSVTLSRMMSTTIVNLPANLPTYDTGTAAGGIANSYGYGTSPSASLYVAFNFTLAATVTPNLALDRVIFDLANAGTNGPRGFEVTYSINAAPFTSLGTFNVPNNSAGNYGRFTATVASQPLLSAGDVVEFRFLGFSTAVGNSVRLDNVLVQGFIIPEPSQITAFTLLVLLALATALAKKRA